MILIDSNSVIYAALPEHEALRNYLALTTPVVSAITTVEVLGYHRLTSTELALFQDFFDAIQVLPVSDDVVQRAITLRQQQKMSLGDSLIAATALTHDLTLVTHNTTDFAQVPDLSVFDPLS